MHFSGTELAEGSKFLMGFTPLFRIRRSSVNLLTALGVARDCELDTVGEAIYNIELHAGQIFAMNEENRELQQLHSEWNTIQINSGFTRESSISEVDTWMKNTGAFLRDELGGTHKEGLGWNSYGVFCGECNRISCVGCKSNVKSKCYV